MNKVLLDTDVFSYLLDGRTEAKKFKKALEGNQILISFISEGELLYGAYRAGWGENRLAKLKRAIIQVEVVYPDVSDSECFAKLVAYSSKHGHPLGQKEHRADAWIAALAISRGHSLATNNFRHFSEAPELDLIVPENEQMS